MIDAPIQQPLPELGAAQEENKDKPAQVPDDQQPVMEEAEPEAVPEI